MTDVLTDLRNRIAERRRLEDEALRQIEHSPELLAAFELLAPFMLNGGSAVDAVKFVNGTSPKIARRGPPTPPAGSYRERVTVALTAHGPLTIEELANHTGLTKDQVRGVVNAPDRKQFFPREIDEATGAGVYRYDEDGEE